MSAPVTAEELAEIEHLDREATPGPWRRWAQPEGVGCLWKDALPPGSICLESTGTVFALGVVVAAIPEGNAVDFDFIAAARTMLPRLARDLTAERAEIQAMANMLDEAGIGHRDGDTVRSRLARMIANANTEGQRTEQAEADRDALAAKIETMLRDEEDARALRIAEHAAREDVAGKLEALRAAVRAHEADARASGHAVPPRDLDLWAAAKVTP